MKQYPRRKGHLRCVRCKDYRPRSVMLGRICTSCHPGCDLEKDRHLRFKYGIGYPDLLRMLAEQGGCAICSAQESGGQGWCIDHDHRCCPGKRTCGACIRGVLCFACNVGLGAFKDDRDVMTQALDYLQANVSRRLPA